jgi:hypothetical protein
MVLMVIFALIGLTAAGYAHLQLGRYIATRTGVLVTRVVLLVLGCAFGYVTADTYPDPSLQLLAFLAGFGAVHIPPAIILLIKRARNSPKT